MGKACEGFQQKTKLRGSKRDEHSLGACQQLLNHKGRGPCCFYLEGSKGWPEFHCTGSTSNAQCNSVHTSKAQGPALSHNPPSFTGSEFSTSLPAKT